ncbi:MAG: hypothetical protein ACRD1R_14370 [Acidobacteriota bacterium]
MKLFGNQPQKVRSSRPGNASRSEKTIRGKMVKDPQCGMYVAIDLAVPAKAGGGEALFFCSQECRRTYLAGLREASEPRP